MSEMEDMRRRLDALEKENARLREASSGNKPKEVTTVVGTYKGHPVLRFEGPFRPFSIGLKKASVILQKLDDVKFFVENNKQRLSTAPDTDD